MKRSPTTQRAGFADNCFLMDDLPIFQSRTDTATATATATLGDRHLSKKKTVFQLCCMINVSVLLMYMYDQCSYTYVQRLRGPPREVSFLFT